MGTLFIWTAHSLSLPLPSFHSPGVLGPLVDPAVPQVACGHKILKPVAEERGI